MSKDTQIFTIFLFLQGIGMEMAEQILVELVVILLVSIFLQIPDGWQFDVDDSLGLGRSGTCTPIGGTVEPVKSLTPGSIVWWTEDPKYAIESFTFGFDHTWDAGDVGWRLITERPEIAFISFGGSSPSSEVGPSGSVGISTPEL